MAISTHLPDPSDPPDPPDAAGHGRMIRRLSFSRIDFG
jgi:hypothetical protein